MRFSSRQAVPIPRTHLRSILALLAGACGAAAEAGVPVDPGALVLRTQTTLHGNFVLIGNTLGQSADAGVPPPIVGSVGAAGSNTADTAPDLFWRSEAPGAGQATADTTITAATARSTAVLQLPAGASVTLARLHWAAETSPGGAGDATVVLSRPGGFSQTVNASSSILAAGDKYGSSADITALVQAHGAGAYRVEGVDCVALPNRNDADVFVGWSMVVVYALAGEPNREITILDGLQLWSGPLGVVVPRALPTPPSAYGARLAIVAFDGDSAVTGDTLNVNGTSISDALNPANNIFNSTRTLLGLSVTQVGDLPQLSGQPNSMSGVDLDTFDVTTAVPASSAAPVTVNINSGSDFLWVGVMVLATQVIDCTSPAILTPPADAAACPPGTATFLVTATGTPLAYEWQIETNPGVYQTLTAAPAALPCGGSAFASVPSGATTPIGVTPCAGQFTYRVRCVVSTPCGTAASAPATLTICTLIGDTNCDGAVNNFDIDSFVLAILDPPDYHLAFPYCNPLNADTNDDNAVNNFDIDTFVGCILNTGCP